MRRVVRAPFLLPLVLLVVLLVLAGCGAGGVDGGTGGTGGTGGVDRGFVAGDGTVRTVAATDRDGPLALTGTTLDGEPFDIADLRGQVVVVTVWGSWCSPCRAEAPAVERVSRATRPDVSFLGVNVKDSPQPARAYLDAFGWDFPSLDAGEDPEPLLALRGIVPASPPSTVVLDRAGRVAATSAGELGEPGLRALIEPVLAEAA